MTVDEIIADVQARVSTQYDNKPLLRVNLLVAEILFLRQQRDSLARVAKEAHAAWLAACCWDAPQIEAVMLTAGLHQVRDATDADVDAGFEGEAGDELHELTPLGRVALAGYLGKDRVDVGGSGQ